MMTHNIIIRHLVSPCVPGRGRRPRRPAFPMASPLASPCARRAVDVAPYHNNMVGIMWHLVFPCIPNNMVGIMWHLVFPCIPGGADVPGGPRPRWRLRWHPRVRVAPEAAAPTRITCRRGTLCSRVSLVGADVPGGPRPDGVSAGVLVCAARRGRRALP